MDLPSSFSTRRESSSCEISRFIPRSVPSTSRRYRIFSPSVILQYAITILQYVIAVNRQVLRAIIGHALRAPGERVGGDKGYPATATLGRICDHPASAWR